jgi:hypothetical protein
MFDDRTIAVIFPTYRERASIRAVIEAFEALGIVDDLVVVNNNAEEGTSDEVRATSAREVLEPRQGYGAAIRRGIAETDADLICIVEPDGTFAAQDLWKLLSYSGEFDFVYGSRTLRDLIWDGANMGRFLRWGNWAVAKLIEMTFNTSSLSDVGCTMRLISGPAARALLPHFTVRDGAFGPEMMLLSVIGDWRVIQVPVNYRARQGRPGTTESFRGALEIGLQMIALVLSHQLRRGRLARQLAAAGASASRPLSTGPGGEPIHMFPQLRRPGANRRSR